MQLLWLKLRGKAEPVTVGKLLARFFQQMGVLWIKMGQLSRFRRTYYRQQFVMN